ncbi:UNKNOWN [Stylonychia lemnae]|uniref:Uncharacterized protein n=1 Tax=Stylonychia lemnae TaxID=5949 RepID=A0A077ZV26_STYLE|nr:UNKNOWN [Stylonychia lemnae]|eukprot:CDW73739.1 UNKNOWN [Stylonychia lemnae]
MQLPSQDPLFQTREALLRRIQEELRDEPCVSRQHYQGNTFSGSDHQSIVSASIHNLNERFNNKEPNLWSVDSNLNLLEDSIKFNNSLKELDNIKYKNAGQANLINDVSNLQQSKDSGNVITSYKENNYKRNSLEDDKLKENDGETEYLMDLKLLQSHQELEKMLSLKRKDLIQQRNGHNALFKTAQFQQNHNQVLGEATNTQVISETSSNKIIEFKSPSQKDVKRGSSFNRYSSMKEKENDEYDESPYQALPQMEQQPNQDYRSFLNQELESSHPLSEQSMTQSETVSQQSRKFVISYSRANKKDSVKVIQQEDYTHLNETQPHSVSSKNQNTSQQKSQNEDSMSQQKTLNRQKESYATVQNLNPPLQVKMIQAPKKSVSRYDQSNQSHSRLTSNNISKNTNINDDTPFFIKSGQTSYRTQDNQVPQQQRARNNNRKSNITPSTTAILSKNNLFQQDILSQSSIYDKTDDDINGSISNIINHMEIIPDEDTVKAEELVLQLHKYIKQKQQVPPELKSQLQVFQEKLQSMLKQSENKKYAKQLPIKVKEATNKQASSIKKQISSKGRNQSTLDVPEFISKTQNLQALNDFLIYSEDLKKFCQNITAKKLQSYSAQINPQKLEVNMGLSYLLLFSNFDNQSIKLTVDKKQLLDRNWNQVQKYFSNHGRVIQQLRLIQQYLDQGRIPAQQLDTIRAQVFSKSLNDDLNIQFATFSPRSQKKVQLQTKAEKGISDVGFDLLLLMRAILKYSEFVQQNTESNIGQKYKRSKSVNQRKDEFPESKVMYSSILKSEESQQQKREKLSTIVEQNTHMENSLERIQRLEKQRKALLSKTPKPIKFTAQFDPVKLEINSKIYNDNLNFERQADKQRKEIEQTRRMIAQMKGKEKQIKWNLLRKQKIEQKIVEKRDIQEYIEYQQELRLKFVEFIADRIRKEKKYINEMKKQIVEDNRFVKIKEDAEYKLKLIDEFKKTIEDYEWNEYIRKYIQEKESKTKHTDFMESLEGEKFYKQQIYAAQKLIENEERMFEKKQSINYEHQKVLREQQQALHDLEIMAKFAI